MPGPPVGLCDRCRHQQVVRTTRGSSFSLCRRSKEDTRYPKYPRIPVLSCPGYEPRGTGTGGEDEQHREAAAQRRGEGARARREDRPGDEQP